MSIDLDPLNNDTRRSKIVTSLRNLIVSGAVSAGQKLTEQALANRLGVSRAPVREAIRELVDSGLLVSVPYRGIFVREFTGRDLEELYSMRAALEKFAFREIWDRRTPEALRDLARRNEALNRLAGPGEAESPEAAHRIIELELELHSWCYELSDHRLLQQAWHRIMPNLQFYFVLHHRAHQQGVKRANSHDDYVALASGDDLEAMITHLDSHLRFGLERTLGFLDSRGPPGP